MSTSNEVALGEKWSTSNNSSSQWTHPKSNSVLTQNDFTYIDDDDQDQCPKTQTHDNESQMLRNRKAMPVNTNLKRLIQNYSGARKPTEKTANPMGIASPSDHGNAISLKNKSNNASNGGETVTKDIHQTNDNSETRHQQQQQIQRLSDNNKVEKSINGGVGGRLNGCCCRRPASSSEECVDDDQADNYCHRPKNNNNIKMTITLTTTTTRTASPPPSPSPPSSQKRNECGLQPLAVTSADAAPATTAMTALTTATTANAIEMASATMTTSATSATTTTTTPATSIVATSSTKPIQRVMIGCSPYDNSNETDGKRARSDAKPTQRNLTQSSCNDTTDNSTATINDECNNDNTMTSSAINTPSMQSPSLSSSQQSPSSAASSTVPPVHKIEAPKAATSQETTKPTSASLLSQAQATTRTVQPTSPDSPAVSSLSSPSPPTGHEVLTKLGNKFGFQATATGGDGFIGPNTSNSGPKPAQSTETVANNCNGGIVGNTSSVTRNMNLSGKDRVRPSQGADYDAKSAFNDDSLKYLKLDDLDEVEDPYYILQEYLERVKTEINEVFEQYEARQKDELATCPGPDGDTADAINQMLSDNKLPSDEMSAQCRLNGDGTYSMKVNGTSSGSDQCDINGSCNSGRYLTVPVAVDTTPSEYKLAPSTPTIMSTNTFPSLNHRGNDQTEQKPSPASSNSRASTLKRLNGQNDYSRNAVVRNTCSPEYLHQDQDQHQLGNSDSSDDVNIWANKFLRELDNLMGSDKWSTARASITGGASAAAASSFKNSIPRPEKHVTIPLQPFNLDCCRLESAAASGTKNSTPNGGGIYSRTLSAPNGNDSNHSLGNCRLLPKNTSGNSVLKIEVNDRSVEDSRRRQYDTDMETIRSTTTLLNQSQTSAGPPAIPKRERVHHTATAGNSNANYQLHNDTTKKGSTSTIWTSEESILRSVGAADEDNNSTSSSACEEASGVLSSGKSGISLDSSGLDNDNNESGIGTATPPKEVGFWKNTADNDSLTSSLDALRKISKFQKGSSVASSDDPDLLEVLSLYDETHDDDVDDDIGIHHDDDHDHDHEEFETNTFDGYGNTDGENTSNGGSSGEGVVLRKKSNLHINESHSGSKDSAIHLLPFTNAQKCRSHSLVVASPPQLRLPFRHELKVKEHNDKGRLCLALRQEPFQSILPSNFNELPSPSSASLHSGHESLGLQELTTKSNSAPLLLKKERKRDDFGGQKQTLRYSRSQSDRYLAEIEAVEACKWLRAAGFPQYAQMYEDHQFPIDLTNVAKDHTNLENDPLQSLYRRLCILNRCANMRLDSSHKPHTPQKEDSDDENCALSENWTFQPHIRRWSRIGEMGLELPTKLTQDKNESSSKESSPDRFEDDDTYDITGAALNLSLPHEHTDGTVQNDSDSSAVRLRRTGSERLKDGAKALLRRVESIKSRRRKRQNREGIVISGPQALDLSQLGQRSIRKPDAVYSTPPSPSAVSPMHMYPKSPLFHHPGRHELKIPSQSENFLSPNRMSSPKRTPTTPRSMRTSPLHFFANPAMPHLKEGRSDDSSSYYSDSQESSSTGGGKLTLSLRKAPSKSRRFLQRTGKVDDIGAHSDSECHQGRKFVFKDANSHNTEMKVKKLTRGGSLNLGKDPKKREGFRTASFRTRSTVRKDHKNSESDTENVKVSKSPVVRWHSFQEEERPHMIFKKCFSRKVEVEKTEGTPFAAMSCGQLQIIRKLALAILTGYMERYCPTHRSGWNWELPKFIKKIKMPDYKDKKVFGVPLLLILQRTGQTLPVPVRSAFRWLQLNALDQIGLFRKSGVKSRIFKLKERIELTESSAECMDVFDTQQAYDVADMLKQFFRDLPESLLTTKMSETFAAIFQHLPPEVRLDAVQCAVLLLPDENREILFALLEFLTLVADNSQYNQMTANNLAVCLAPSLFHNSISTGTSSVSASPRRRKTTGVPDVKELSEAKASHECLSFMIDNYRQIFTASRERISKCNFGYMEESKPVPLEALGEGMQFHNWRGYLYECTSATIKEGREKSRGWFTITSLDTNVDIAYKKVGDGHPLRLWRCITEVEGPPKDVLDYVLKQRASWDNNLLQSQTIKKLDERTEIFQYVFDGQMCTDFCVLRSWQTDLPRGACVIVETSIDHPKARPIFGSVRGVVLASRYLIEPCGSGRSRIMHLARVDIKGKTPEWYNKSYGHICSHYLSKIKLAFRHVADGPESKV